MERSPIPEPIRRRLSLLSESVFNVRRGLEETERELKCWIGQQVSSSLPLQMCLYFNLYFYPFWWACKVTMVQLKYPVLSNYYRIVLSALLTMMTLVEVIRLMLGYMGNLQEKVPELAGFWLLTLLLQIPMTLFDTCNPKLAVLPLEYGASIVYLALLLAEVLLAFITLRHMVEQLELRFHMSHFDSLEGQPGAEMGAGQSFSRASNVGQRFPGASTEDEGPIGLSRLSRGSTSRGSTRQTAGDLHILERTGVNS
ncbi:transmembrane protein 17B-like isoform X1 [Heterodontus francisci]|uniref:transmembrane protein 17B-like isoform X1 n=1 Tax=Heterodontus francisci TaxID=7792 RepID=UPI00355BD8C2